MSTQWKIPFVLWNVYNTSIQRIGYLLDKYGRPATITDKPDQPSGRPTNQTDKIVNP